jgi:hypothetical protein
MRRKHGRWSAPYVDTRFDGRFFLPVFSADGRKAYFSSARPGSVAAKASQTDFDIWFVEKRGDDWGEPKCLNLVARYPELRWAGFPSMLSITRNGTLYFMGYTPGPLNDYGIFRSELVNGEYAKPDLLPRSINLPPFLNWEPFIAPDESYLLFSSNRRDPDHDDWRSLCAAPPTKRQLDRSGQPGRAGQYADLQERLPWRARTANTYSSRDGYAGPGSRMCIGWTRRAFRRFGPIATPSHENPK